MFLSSGEFILGTGGKNFYQHTVTLRFEEKKSNRFQIPQEHIGHHHSGRRQQGLQRVHQVDVKL